MQTPRKDRKRCIQVTGRLSFFCSTCAPCCSMAGVRGWDNSHSQGPKQKQNTLPSEQDHASILIEIMKPKNKMSGPKPAREKKVPMNGWKTPKNVLHLFETIYEGARARHDRSSNLLTVPGSRLAALNLVIDDWEGFGVMSYILRSTLMALNIFKLFNP